MEIKTITGMEDLVLTQTEKTNHGGELIFRVTRKSEKSSLLTEEIAVGIDCVRLKSELATQITTQPRMHCKFFDLVLIISFSL